MGALAKTESADAGVSVREEFDAREVTRSAETSMSAVVAQQRAMVEARFVVAMRNKRHWGDVRAHMNSLCVDPEFAAEALYVKPIAKTPDHWEDWNKRERLQRAPEDWPRGFSIRFLESFLFEAGNFDCKTLVVWEDDHKRMTDVMVADLERNSAYSRTVTTLKTVERRSLKRGQQYIGTRTNSYGDLIYIINATDDEVNLKEAAGVSKAIRTLAERLMPPHLKREWRNIIEKTITDETAKDPQAAKKRILDSFATQGVLPSFLDQYLGHPIESATPAELLELRGVYVALAAGEATWTEAMRAKHPQEDGEDATDVAPAAKALKERIEAQRSRAASSTGTPPPNQAASAHTAAPQPAPSDTTTQAPAAQPGATGAQETAKGDELPDRDLINEADRIEGTTGKRPSLEDLRRQRIEGKSHPKGRREL